MNLKELWREVKKAWDWIWNSDSILSWIVALAIIFIFVKYIFFPTLSLITGSSLPLAGVESSSMDHQIVKDQTNIYSLCGKPFSKENVNHINFDEYWEICGGWYEEREISKDRFAGFSFKDGFKKGDIIVVWGRFTPKVGDVVIFQTNPESTAPRPIIHRIVSVDEEGIIQTKGDHNANQLTRENNFYRTDETKIYPEQIIGKAIFKIPYLGWVKIWVTEIVKRIIG
jgi:hypothetical protein